MLCVLVITCLVHITSYLIILYQIKAFDYSDTHAFQTFVEFVNKLLTIKCVFTSNASPICGSP